MGDALIDQAIELLEKANADLEPELLPAPAAKKMLAAYNRAERLAAYGVAALARKLDDASEVARVTGTSMGKAKATVATGTVMSSAEDLSEALRHGDISLDQAAEIATAEDSAPGAAAELVAVARNEAFHVLRDKARQAKLEAEQHRDLAPRQHAARFARSHSDELGMSTSMSRSSPTSGPRSSPAPRPRPRAVANRRRQTGSRSRSSVTSPMRTRHCWAGGGKAPARRPELVVLVSHEVAKRGWTKVEEGELCKIPGIGPVAPEVAREIAKDAFLSGVFYDGKDLRNFARWTRNIPIEVLVALELGEPPSFDGVACVDCGNRFGTEFDHVTPRFAHGPSSQPNLKPRCWSCHQAKTRRERKVRRFKPADT